MPEAFVLYGQLQRRGVTVEAMRGIGQTRQPNEAWMLPIALRLKIGALLRDLGFDAARDVWVHDLPHQHVFRLTQRTNEEERREASQERRRGQLRWFEGTDRQ
jgi:hypothetical protein